MTETSAADFDALYASRDPWGIARASFRDRALRSIVTPWVRGERVLELGCGEGHLTKALFASAERVLGVDISKVALERAVKLNIANARFVNLNLMSVSFEGFDVIAAIECINYLSKHERMAFFAKVKREHMGVTIITNPIIGGKYWTHAGLMAMFDFHGFKVLSWHNIYPRQTGLARPVDLAIRISGQTWLLDILPERLVYQRAYVIN